jgi:hypothetical protein
VKRRPQSQIDAPGQDSFLDVVCNLGGILIVLVMLIAAQAKRGMIASAAAKNAPAITATSGEVETAAKTADAIERSVQELQAKINRQNLEAMMRQEERNKFQLLVTVAEQRLAEHRGQLSSDERSRYDLEQQLAKSKAELTRLDETQKSLARPRAQVLEHLPTPMARTVFGTEIHFRLQGHRLAYVPWDEMLEQMKADAPGQVHKLRSQPRVEVSLPVIAGFGARYAIKTAQMELQTRLGPATQSQIVLEKIYFVDAEPNLGQPVSQAVSPTSEFRSRLAAQKPQGTTVTIWVYPDSFDDFRAIKAELFKLGFLCAARPMHEDHPIGGSPDGTRSSAE